MNNTRKPLKVIHETYRTMYANQIPNAELWSDESFIKND